MARMDGGYRRRRRRTQKGWAQIPNRMINDKDMTAEAVGLCCYLLSKSDDWEGRAKNIENRFGVGYDGRRTMTRKAELCGWLRLVRLRLQGGAIRTFYEAQDVQLPLDERTNSSDLESVPIWKEEDFLQEESETDPYDDEGGTPGKTGGVPPAEPRAAEPRAAEPRAVEPGDIRNTELLKTEERKTEGVPLPQIWHRYREALGHDLLAAYPECVKNAAFELAEYQLSQDKVGCVPVNVPTFPGNAELWAKALAFHGKGKPPAVEGLLRRGMAYLALDRTQRNYALPTWKMLDEIGIGEKSNGKPIVPLAPAPNPEHVQKELLERHIKQCIEAVKEEIRRSPRISVTDAIAAKSKYALDVRTAALQRIMNDQALAEEIEEARRSGPRKFRFAKT